MDSVSNASFSRLKPDVIIFGAQVLLLFIVVITSLVNLSLERGNTNLWTMILTSCLGYMLPSPSLKKAKANLPKQDSAEKDGVILRDTALKRDQSAS